MANDQLAKIIRLALGKMTSSDRKAIESVVHDAETSWLNDNLTLQLDKDLKATDTIRGCIEGMAPVERERMMTVIDQIMSK